MKRIFIYIVLTLCLWKVQGQVFETADGRFRIPGDKAMENVVADGFWKHRFVQAGLDMSLMNPYGYNTGQDGSYLAEYLEKGIVK